MLHFSEHQELNRQIHEATDIQLRDDLERELDHLVGRMEVKGDQIAKIRRHQEMVRHALRFLSRRDPPNVAQLYKYSSLENMCS